MTDSTNSTPSPLIQTARLCAVFVNTVNARLHINPELEERFKAMAGTIQMRTANHLQAKFKQSPSRETGIAFAHAVIREADTMVQTCRAIDMTGAEIAAMMPKVMWGNDDIRTGLKAENANALLTITAGRQP